MCVSVQAHYGCSPLTTHFQETAECGELGFQFRLVPGPHPRALRAYAWQCPRNQMLGIASGPFACKASDLPTRLALQPLVSFWKETLVPRGRECSSASTMRKTPGRGTGLCGDTSAADDRLKAGAWHIRRINSGSFSATTHHAATPASSPQDPVPVRTTQAPFQQGNDSCMGLVPGVNLFSESLMRPEFSTLTRFDRVIQRATVLTAFPVAADEGQLCQQSVITPAF